MEDSFGWDDLIEFYVNEMGWNLLPVPKNEKAYFKKWKAFQSKLFPIEQLKKHRGNLAVVQGKISGNFIKLDFDTHFNNEFSTRQLLRQVLLVAPELENCLAIKSQSGGLHIGVLLDDMKIYNGLKRKMGIWCRIPGIKEIDIKGEGGLAMIPPSEIKGNQYTFLNARNLEELRNKDYPRFTAKEFNDIYEKLGCLGFQSTVLKNLKHKAHRAIARGEIQIHSYSKGSQTSDEFNYWYAFELDCIHIGCTDEEILFMLQRTQQNCKDHKVLSDLKFLRGDNRKPYKMQTLNEMYPEKEYQTSFTTADEVKQYNIWDEQLQELYYKEKGSAATYIRGGKTLLTANYKKWVNNLQQDQDLGDLDPYSICNEILKRYNIACPLEWKKTILIYEDGVWKEKSSETMEHFLIKYFIEIKYHEFASDSEINQKISITKKFIREATACSLDEFDSNPYLINLMNCVLDISDINNVKEYTHKPHFKIRRQLPIYYNKKAKCRETTQMLINIFNQEDIPLIIQKIGLSYTTIMDFQKATILFGGGNNGKTTFYNWLTDHLGKKNTSHVDPIDFKDGFLISRMECKLANILSEVNTQQELDITTLKMHVGAEGSYVINKKYERPYECEPTAKHWYGCNDDFMNIPNNADKGFFRKFNIVECPNNFDGIEDRGIKDRIRTKEEFSGMFNVALKALIKLIKDDKFTNSCIALTHWEDVKEFWIQRRNPFSMFIIEMCEKGIYTNANVDPDNDYWELKDTVLKYYNEWLNKKGKPPTQPRKLTGLVKQAGLMDARRRIDGRQQPIYAGFRIKNKDIEIKKEVNKQKRLDDKIEDAKKEIHGVNIEDECFFEEVYDEPKELTKEKKKQLKEFGKILRGELDE
jgi:putative DNA primase/helicase